ncbi:TfoX/Sxy family protein [Oscillospiraceae bacterium PP1C4]
MGELSKLPNISGTIEGKLNQAGIQTAEQLKELGSKESFLRIRLNDNTACVNMLYAIEGAIEGIRWHGLDQAVKQDLKNFHSGL